MRRQRRREFQLRRFRECRKSRGRSFAGKKGLPQRDCRGSLYCKQTACIDFEKLGTLHGVQRCTCSPLVRRNYPRKTAFSFPCVVLSNFLSTLPSRSRRRHVHLSPALVSTIPKILTPCMGTRRGSPSVYVHTRSLSFRFREPLVRRSSDSTTPDGPQLRLDAHVTVITLISSALIDRKYDASRKPS